MAWFSPGDFSPSSLFLFCLASSAAPQGTSRGGSFRDTCGMEIDVSCEDGGWCELPPTGMLELGGFSGETLFPTPTYCWAGGE